MYEHNDTIKTEISLHLLPNLFPFPNVVGLDETRETTIRVIMPELCDGISVTKHEVHCSINLNGLYKA